MENSFQRYLQAKRTVDDRALNRVVWQQLMDQLAFWQASRPIHVLEIGAGIGTMLQRLMEWGGLKQGNYLGIDSDLASVEAARNDLPHWAAEHNYTCTQDASGFELSDSETKIRAAFSPLEVQEYIESPSAVDFDLVIANAFLDLVDPAVLLPDLGRLLEPGALGWFTINFDGMTVFEPVIDPILDGKIIHLYHQSMDERRINGQPTGGSRTGRHLYHQLTDAGWQVLAAGASDWVVHPVQGVYAHDEAYFLEYILHFFDQTLNRHPQLDPAAFQAWLAARRAQIDDGDLVFFTHQLDFLARWPG